LSDDKEKVSANIEDYLKTIYQLSENDELVKTTSIAKNLNIAPGSVTQMLKKLYDLGFVEYSPYEGTKLTEDGLRLAKKIIRKHRLLERFMYGILKLKKTDVHSQACEMEHTLSDTAERALCQVLEHPDTCPDDDALIPECDLEFTSCDECMKAINDDLEKIGKRNKNLVSLIKLKKNQKGRISFIRGDYKLLQELSDEDITIGTMISMVNIDHLSDQVEVSVEGSQLTIGKEIARNIFVDTKES